MAGDSIGKLSAIITADSRGFQAATARVAQDVRQLTQATRAGWGEIGSAMGAGLSEAMGALGRLGTIASLAGAATMFREFIDEARQATNMAREFGVSVEFIEAVGIAAKVSGADFDAAAQAMVFFEKNLGEAWGGSEEAADKFRKLGLSLEDLMGMTQEEHWEAFARALMKVSDETMRIYHARELGGRGGVRALPLFEEIAGGAENQYWWAVPSASATGNLRFAGEAIASSWALATRVLKEFAGGYVAMTQILGRAAVGDLAGARDILTGTAYERQAKNEAAARRELADAAYREALAKKHLAEVQKEEAEHMRELLAMAEQRQQIENRAADMAQRLADQIEVLYDRKSEGQVQVEEFLRQAADMPGMDPAKIAGWREQLLALTRQVDQAREWQKANRDAAAAIKEAATAEEKFAEAARQAHAWRRGGFISADQEARLIKKAQEDLLRSWQSGERLEPAPLARRGSAEEYAIIAKAVTAAQQNQALTSRLDTIAQNTADTARAVERAGAQGGKIVSIPP